MINKKHILLGSLALIAASAFIFNSFLSVEKQYSEIESNQGTPYSIQEERALLWQQMNANVNSGIVETSDFNSTLEKIKSRPNKKAADFIPLIDEGPDNVGGRTRGICVDVNDTDIIYAGSVSGGLFKSVNKGGAWNVVKTFSENLSIMSMDMTPDGTLYVGTGGGMLGESYVSNGASGNYGGDGVWESNDGGATFTQVNGTSGWNVSNVLAHPTENKVFFIGSSLGVKIYDGSSMNTSTGAPTSGILSDIEISPDGNTLVCGNAETYLSTNGGESFSNVTGSPTSGKIVSGGNNRYAISHENNANGFYNIFCSQSSGSGSLGGIWMSPDGGTKWIEIGPSGSANFNPFGSNNQGNYDNTITVIKGKPNEILIGGVDLWHWELTTDLSNPWGQWTRVSEWAAAPNSVKYVHADQHEMKWDKDGNLYFGNDGGVFTYIAPFPEDVTYLTFKHLARGYNTLQFYSLSHGVNGEVLAGAQDNGTQYNNHTGGTHKEAFEVSGGDGFDCEISQLNPEGQIYSIYYASLSRTDDEGNNRISMPTPCPGETAGESCGSFYTKLGLKETLNDPNSRDSVDYVVPEDTLILDGASFDFTYPSANFAIEQNGTFDNTTGADVLLKSGSTITVVDRVQSLFVLSIPGDGVYATRDAWKFGQSPEWWKILGSENGFSGSAVSFEFSNDMEYLYVGTSSGDIWRIDGLNNSYSAKEADLITAFNQDPVDNLLTVVDIFGTKFKEPFSIDFINNTYFDIITGDPVEFNINRTLIYNGSGIQSVLGISVDPNDPEHIVGSLGGFSASVNIVESTNAATTTTSTTFSSIQGDLPNMPTYSAVIDKDDSNYIIAGTAFGLWYSQDGGSSWNENNESIGRVPVYRVSQDLNESNIGTELEGAIYLATHGRGYWSTNGHLFDPVSVEENENINTFKSDIEIFPNPVNETANVSFNTSNASNVTINIMSLEGKIVQSKSEGIKNAGNHRLNINTNDLPNGIYVIQVIAGKTSKTGKFIKL